MESTRKNRFILAPTSPLIVGIRNALYLRDTELVRQLTTGLGWNLARHYNSLAENNYEIGNLDLSIPDSHKASVLLACAQVCVREGDYRVARLFLRDSYRYADKYKDSIAQYLACKEAILIDSREGNHKAALSNLDTLYPVIKSLRHTYPPLYYDFFNSLSVELAATNNTEAAHAAIQIAIDSPFTFCYPEWRETKQEIGSMPKPRSHNVPTSPRSAPGEVVDITKYKINKASQKTETEILKQQGQIVYKVLEWPIGDLRWKIIARLTEGDMSHEKQEEILAIASNC